MAKSLFGRDHDGYVGRDEHTVSYRNEMNKTIILNISSNFCRKNYKP